MNLDTLLPVLVGFAAGFAVAMFAGNVIKIVIFLVVIVALALLGYLRLSAI